MLINNEDEYMSNLDFQRSQINGRRNTDKISIYNEDQRYLTSGLEPINELIDYTKGNELPPGSVGVCCHALNNTSAKVIIVKTLDFSELTREAVDERFGYLEK